jgi:prophage tail gpP-like protein
MTDAPSDEIVVTGKRKKGGNEVSIKANGVVISGWTSVRITRGIEICPNSFELTLTEKYPGASDVVVKAGTPCQVMIGDSVVVTGYVDRFKIAIGPDSHELSIQGRGKCSDLVDCDAEWQGNQISGSSALGIAQKLASPYGIPSGSLTVSLGDAVVEPPTPIPQFNFSLGEKAWEIIEKICRYRGLLAYERADGNLVLDQVGLLSAASGFTQGVNVESANMTFSMDQRYSIYRVYLTPMSILGEDGAPEVPVATAKDQFVPRYRDLDFICESGAGGQDISSRRAKWEMGRRFGRSFALNLTTDTWRDSATTLWTPNTKVLINIPALKLANQTWVISEVVYRRGDDGTHADLVIMPESAFQPEPVLLQPNYQAEVNPTGDTSSTFGPMSVPPFSKSSL